jgi:von Willebrand factor type A domain
MRQSLIRIGAIAMALAAFGCGGTDRPPTRSFGDGGDIAFDGGTNPPPKPPAPCTDGATKECGYVVSKHEGVVTCFKGTQVCTDGVWGDCVDGITSTIPDNSGQASSSTQSLGTPDPCATNPCDPFCHIYDENPDGGVAPDGGGGTFDWQGGSLSSIPKGLAQKGLKEPCGSGYDCQFNNYCYHPVTGAACSHSKCQTGAGLDPTCDSCVTDICAQDPSCCKPGSWTQGCVDKVKTSCDAQCGSPQPTTCAHDVCTQGSELSANCDSCVAKICAVDAACCTSGNSSWNSTCVNEVASVCGLSCPVDMQIPPSEEGACKPWLPGQTDPSCTGFDLSGGIPCSNTIPVCNHGTTTAPAGIKIIHFPANSLQYPKCNPDQTHPQMVTCTTKQAIPPGQCIDVTDCPGLSGNREIMINPQGAGNVAECNCQDNWTLYSGGTCSAPTCAAATSQQGFKPINLYFLVDRSYSMSLDSGGIKWTAAQSALKAFFQSPGSAGMGVALEWFSLPKGGSNGDGCGDSSCSGGECAPAPCSSPQMPLALLTSASGAADQQETKLVTAVNNMTASGFTPTYPALKGALQWATAQQSANQDKIYAVVLVTDGDPNSGCNDNITSIAALASSARIDSGVKTYVVGLPGSTTANLNAIANGGGTGSAFMVSGANAGQIATQMQTAFETIQASNLQCSFDLPTSGAFDPNSATVRLVSSGGTETTLGKHADATGCGNGWYYDNAKNPTKLILCPTTCSAGQSDPGATLAFDIGCASSYQESQYSQTYEAVCPPGTKPLWNVLGWDTSCPSDSSVLFQGRTATTQAGLATAAFQTLGTATSTPTNLQTCALTGPSPCPVDLYDKLGVPAAKFPWFELMLSLKPSSDGSTGPTVNKWDITYTCPQAE